MRNIVVTMLIALLPYPARAQKSTATTPAQVAQEVREYRLANEDRIVRELAEFLSIPNVASDTPNIQKNAAHLVEMLEARGIETHLFTISGRGPVVFGIHRPGLMESPLNRYFETRRLRRVANASLTQQTAPSIAQFIRTTGAFMRALLPTTNHRLWRCSRRSMPCGIKRFPWR